MGRAHELAGTSLSPLRSVAAEVAGFLKWDGS